MKQGRKEGRKPAEVERKFKALESSVSVESDLIFLCFVDRIKLGQLTIDRSCLSAFWTTVSRRANTM